MDRADVLASLSGAQRELDAHLNNARTTLMSLPHTASDLTPMKTVMGSFHGARVPHPQLLAEELWVGESHYGATTFDVVPTLPTVAGQVVPFDPSQSPWSEWLTAITTNIGRYTHFRMHQFATEAAMPFERKYLEATTPLVDGIARVTGILASTSDSVATLATATERVTDLYCPSSRRRNKAMDLWLSQKVTAVERTTAIVNLDREWREVEEARARARSEGRSTLASELSSDLKTIESRQRNSTSRMLLLYENVSMGSQREKPTLDLSSVWKTDDRYSVIDYILSHTERFESDYPLIACDLRLIVGNFDPVEGLHHTPNFEADWPRNLHAQYHTESVLLFRRLRASLTKMSVVHEVIGRTHTHGFATTNKIRIDEGVEDGVLLFRVLCAMLIPSSGEHIRRVINNVENLWSLFISGDPAVIVNKESEYFARIRMAERYGVRVKWIDSGRLIIEALAKRSSDVGVKIDIAPYTDGGSSKDDALELLDSIASHITTVCTQNRFNGISYWGSRTITLDDIEQSNSFANVAKIECFFGNTGSRVTPKVDKQDLLANKSKWAEKCRTYGCLGKAPWKDGRCQGCQDSWRESRFGKNGRGRGAGDRGRGGARGRGRGRGAKGGRGQAHLAEVDEYDEDDVDVDEKKSVDKMDPEAFANMFMANVEAQRRALDMPPPPTPSQHSGFMAGLGMPPPASPPTPPPKASPKDVEYETQVAEAMRAHRDRRRHHPY